MVEVGSQGFPQQEIGLPRELPHGMRWTLRTSLADELGTYYRAAFPNPFDPDLSESDRILAEHAKSSARYRYLILRNVVEAGDHMRVEANALADDFTAGMGDSFNADLFIDSFFQVGTLVEELVEKTRQSK
jgi:hypothetical protein